MKTIISIVLITLLSSCTQEGFIDSRDGEHYKITRIANQTLVLVSN